MLLLCLWGSKLKGSRGISYLRAAICVCIYIVSLRGDAVHHEHEGNMIHGLFFLFRLMLTKKRFI